MPVYTIILTIRDSKGHVSPMEINVPGSTAYGDVQAFASQLASAVDDVIAGVIDSVVITQAVIPGSIKTLPSSTSDVEEGARFQFATTGGRYTAFRLPTFPEDFIVLGSREVDTNDALVSTLVSLLTTYPICDKRGEEVTALTTAREQFLRSRGTIRDTTD